ncbi:DUF4932 domain-containing protein [Pedobacter sp. MC2016-15]|uniref:DUF4932 domain-containing protein n=1 Tax=Pedobacter sp. MC2016-15 TaxID=2994473 RepID=UPI002247A406|nr:DUF4932 domain-containing protein [Pedobacter sp. MC2016-15]MCX2480247.1 DUF4932 domain-containing protein [Pedobacter sp. MC2016-15]
MRSTLSLLSLILCLSLSALAGFSQTPTTFQSYQVEVKGVNFSVDPRIEFFHTVEVLSGLPLVNFIELDYKQDILIKLAPYKNHPLFAYLKRNSLYGKLFNSIDAPIWTMLHMTEDLEWRKDIPVAEAKDPGLDSLRLLMKDFAKKSNYVQFFNSHADFFRIALSTLTYNLPNFNEKDRLLNYCGSSGGKNIRFNVILNFLGWGNFGPRIFKKDGAGLYAVIAPEKTAIRVPTFDVSALYRLLWHEFAHSFANPAVEKHQSQFDQFEWMWHPIKEPMKAQGYHSWQSVVKEHLTEAIACRMAALKFGENAADLNYVRRQYGMQWIYLHPLLDALKYYEKNRRKYPTLESFIPEIITAFKQVKQSDIDPWMAETDIIRKPKISSIPIIDDIYGQKDILFVLSSDETDKEADRKLKDFINRFKNMVPALKDGKVVMDTTALKMNLTNYNLSVWGTPHGNKFLQKYIRQIPLLIEDKKVIAENIYQGTGYGILMAWVNPLNTEKVMAIYTGQNPADVIDFNQIPNGAGNYHIFNNKVTLKQGTFIRQNDIWFAK